MKSNSTLIVDNGGFSIKAGTKLHASCRIFPNGLFKTKSDRRRLLVANQLDECSDLSSLYFMLPFQKVKFKETSLVFTEPQFNFQSIQQELDEIFFEEYEFSSLLRTTPAMLSSFKHLQSNPDEHCCLVVDSGYSFTHIVPFFRGLILKDYVLRIDVGGKALTNHLKEIISYRQLQVLEETYVINQCKEDVCFVSCDFKNDLIESRKKALENVIIQEYVLPDYSRIHRGFARKPELNIKSVDPDEQVVRLANERFCVPEILFYPSDIGIKQMGISEAIVHTIELAHHFYKNIVLTGGNCCFPNFKERVLKDVRACCPSAYDTNVYVPDSPVTYCWEGGVQYSKNPYFNKHAVTRRLYFEHGHNICKDRFSN